MKKLKFNLSFLLLILICLLTKNVLVFINYALALILHELAHLFIASKLGYSLKFVKLNIFGLSVELNEKIGNQDNFYINIAGPMFNLLLCIICVAFYWLIPESFKVLNIFCMCNLVLAIFNLIPVYPLDGGKIFSTLIENEKKYKITSLIIRLILIGVFLVLFFLSLIIKPNFFFLLIAFFFCFPNKREPNFSIFKTHRNKGMEKITLVKISGEEDLLTLIKKLKSNQFIIFYYNDKKPFCLDQDKLIEFSTKYPLLTKIKEILERN